ncbi:hypothetical protein [Delftia tsuruhatensis]|uniref:hypothetical protein n=1 Tax=Delftia tsuruhatensis TaxID=180282 RepID=UPI002027AC2E|nr:hypothetical protein [Delftia tsuruhatensis]
MILRVLFLAAGLCVAGPASAANMATCLLDKLPGTQNDVAAQAVFQVCSAEHPGGIQAVPQGDGRGMLGFKSGPECTAKKAGDTRSTRAAELIGVACRRLYDGPDWERGELSPPKK